MSKKIMKYVVYCHTNKINGKKYVGITGRKPTARWGSRGQNYKNNEHFSNAINKYGWDNFNHEILFEYLTEEEALSKEKELIAEWDLMNVNKGYNKNEGGSSPKHTEESRKKISRKNKGRGLGVKPVNFKSMIGNRYGRLVVIDEYTKKRKHYCKCQCDCGIVKIIESGCLRDGHTKSCGCLAKDGRLQLQRKYGPLGAKLYKTWKYMRYKCYNKKIRAYKTNGALGIKVCDEWIDNFEAFFNWAMSNGYKEDLKLVRTDVSKDYEPSNCFWGSIKDISKKAIFTNSGKYKVGKGTPVYCITLDRKFSSASEASRELGINRAHVAACCRGELKSSGGYMWRYADNELAEKFCMYPEPKRSFTPVRSVEDNKEYKTITEAAKALGTRHEYIRNVLDNPNKTCMGMHWIRLVPKKCFNVKNKSTFKPVICVETGIVYESMNHASRATNICRSCIRDCCSGKQKSAGGFHWEHYSINSNNSD